MLKSYIVSFNGHYLPGTMIVVDKSKKKAFKVAKETIDKMGLSDKNEDFALTDLTLMYNDFEHVTIITDGDY